MSNRSRVDVSFPLRLDNRGRLATCGYEQHVRELLEQLLFTQPGERVNRPDFGTPIPAMIFDRPTPEMLTNLEFRINTSVQRFLNEVVVLENVEVDVDENCLSVRLQYRILKTNHTVEETFTS